MARVARVDRSRTCGRLNRFLVSCMAPSSRLNRFLVSCMARRHALDDGSGGMAMDDSGGYASEAARGFVHWHGDDSTMVD